ncbi:MAG: VWA domain-containing protein [Anaerolineales bacterium]|nr:VWA domain-containing protein [Anaerolineales bacterium]MCS7248073.1 VWA domain-containing protein [Anaerolineales bacterium]MDW8161885.1 VWA domain-containing protein [Anaerolineales bacterium]MDW8445832.1 VWA domain-containing protein [Anaerolineales bacterium]
MEERTLQFIAALRASGVRVSLAESADAFQAMLKVGVQDRNRFRQSLRTTLIKERRDIPIFEQLFDLFFQAELPPGMQNLFSGLSEEEATKIAEVLRQFAQELRRRMEKILRGEPLSPEELAELDQWINAHPSPLDRNTDRLLQRYLQALQFEEVREALEELLQALEELGLTRQKIEQLRQGIQQNLQALEEQLRAHVGERRRMESVRPRPRSSPSDLLHRPLQHLSPREMEILRKETRRLAAALRTRLALRLRRERNGKLDAKATLRASLKSGNVPMELCFRNRTQKPKIVILCDVSTSMRFCSELMLSLLYSIQDQITHTHAFAYIDHLEYISPDFECQPVQQAIEQVLWKLPPGYYNTDLGQVLGEFERHFLYTLDRRTTLIIVGDGRNNYNPSRADLLERFSHRARSLYWLNPEPPWMWGSGDSDMLEYFPYCRKVLPAANLAQLIEAIDAILLPQARSSTRAEFSHHFP